MSTTGKETQKGKHSHLTLLSADDPIYSTGYVIQMRHSGRYSHGSRVKRWRNENEKPQGLSDDFLRLADRQIEQEAREQMSGEYGSEETGPSASPTGAGKKGFKK